jgi:hypothetical protein
MHRDDEEISAQAKEHQLLWKLHRLKRGQDFVDEAAKNLDKAMQAGRTGTLSDFSSLLKDVSDVGNSAMHQQKEFLPGLRLNLD